MKLLLDTHIFLWYISADSQLPSAFRDAIRDPANEVYLSVASVWEAVIKYALGKLPLSDAPAVYLPRQREAYQITATAHKLGRIVYHLMRYGEGYVHQEEAVYAQQVREHLEKQLHRRARELGYELKKVESPSAEGEPTAVP